MGWAAEPRQAVCQSLSQPWALARLWSPGVQDRVSSGHFLTGRRWVTFEHRYQTVLESSQEIQHCPVRCPQRPRCSSARGQGQTPGAHPGQAGPVEVSEALPCSPRARTPAVEDPGPRLEMLPVCKGARPPRGHLEAQAGPDHRRPGLCPPEPSRHLLSPHLPSVVAAPAWVLWAGPRYLSVLILDQSGEGAAQCGCKTASILGG